MRVALYWAPRAVDPLAQLGAAWLGRDAETGACVLQPDIVGIAEWTGEPRRYGLHATFRPPVRLATEYAIFRDAARRIAALSKPFPLPTLALTNVGGFLALTMTAPCAAVQDLADLCVQETECCRLAASAEELERRRAAGLSPRQEALLLRWGYPYVMEEWVFHVTLTRRLSDVDRCTCAPLAARHFEAALTVPRLVEDICIFTDSGGEFRIVERLSLGCDT